MIKITHDNATLPISENKNLIKHLNDAYISWDLANNYASFSAINASIGRLFENRSIADSTKAVLVLLPEKAYGDIVGDFAALRKYDSNPSPSNDMTFKIMNNANCYIIPSTNIINGFILCMSDLNIVPEKTVVTVGDITIETNKDLSKVDINVVGSVKLTNIKVR